MRSLAKRFWRKAIFWGWRLLQLGVILAVIALLQDRLDRMRPEYEIQDYLYLSKNKEFRRFAFGFEGVYADLLWVTSLQGFHKHCLAGVVFSNSPLFRAGFFRNAAGLVKKIMESEDPFARYLREQLPASLRQGLTAVAIAGYLPRPVEKALVEELNRLLRGPALYEEKRFAQLSLSKSTRRLLARNPQGEDLLRLNRLLLEEAYPQEIAPIPSSDIQDVYEAITDLDPYFEEAYRTGSLYTIIAKKEARSGIELLESGTRKIPQVHWIWSLLGHTCFLYRDQLEKEGAMSKIKATTESMTACNHAVALGAPQEIADFAEWVATRSRGVEMDLYVWITVYQKSAANTLLKHLSLTRMRLQIIAEHLRQLQAMIAEFQKKQGRFPSSLEELAAFQGIEVPGEPELEELRQFVEAIPPHRSVRQVVKELPRLIFKPSSRLYRYDPLHGEVQSTTLAHEKADILSEQIQRLVDRYYQNKGFWPNRLEEVPALQRWQEKGLLPLSLGEHFAYDPKDGKVSVIDQQEE